MADAMTSAAARSSGSPCVTVRRSALNTSFGRRRRWASSPKVSDPKMSVALGRVAPDGLFLSPHSMMLLVACCSADEPMVDNSFQQYGTRLAEFDLEADGEEAPILS